MTRKNRTLIAVATVASTIALLGTLTGIAEGRGGPAGIVLTAVEGGASHSYRLRDTDGDRTGSLESFREPVVDADGNEVGAIRTTLFASENVAWHSTSVVTLLDGPHTDRGTIVFTGLFKGFNGEKMAVTGGTGAYAGASGYATLSVEQGEFTRTITLMP